MPDPVADHFDSLERQANAARLGMWVFLASEALLFSGMFALYASYRAHYPEGFAVGVEHAKLVIGTANTVILLVSSFFVAWALAVLRTGRPRASGVLVAIAIALGIVFLCLKMLEYHEHLTEGIDPAGRGFFFDEHDTLGIRSYFTLYYITTGAHAIHVLVGTLVLSVYAWALFRRRLDATRSHRLEVAALYWHLVDIMWIFIWPLYYLIGKLT